MLIFSLNLIIMFSVVLLIMYPLLKKAPLGASPVPSEGKGRLRELLFKKETTYAALKELEFDYKTGKLSPEDYQELVNNYRQKALLILKEIDQFQRGEVPEDEIEKEIQQLKEKTGRSQEGESLEDYIEVEKEIQKFKKERLKGKKGEKPQLLCGNCGEVMGETDKFCSQCGSKRR